MKRTVYRFSENPVLGYVFKENYRDTGNPDLTSSFPSINSHGFRDIERAYRKPEGVQRIILLGDSVVAGALNIRDLDDTISRQLEKILEPRHVEVLNMGINGYCTLAEVEILRERGLRYSPDLVILIFVNNDYQNINSDLGMVSLPGPIQFFFLNSHLFRYAGTKFNLFGLRARLGIEEIENEWVGFLRRREQDRVDRILNSQDPRAATVKGHLSGIGDRNVHRALPVLKRLSQEHGFQVLLVNWPTFQKEGFGDLESWGELRAVEAGELLEVERIADAAGIPRTRLTSAFILDYLQRSKQSATPLPDPREFYTNGDDMHPNPLGAKVAARALARILENNPALLPPAP